MNFYVQIALNKVPPPAAPEPEKRERWRAKPATRERKFTSVRPEPEVPDFLKNPTSTWIYGNEDFSTTPAEKQDDSSGVFLGNPS